MRDSRSWLFEVVRSQREAYLLAVDTTLTLHSRRTLQEFLNLKVAWHGKTAIPPYLRMFKIDLELSGLVWVLEPEVESSHRGHAWCPPPRSSTNPFRH
jgi:hypothetical protein